VRERRINGGSLLHLLGGGGGPGGAGGSVRVCLSLAPSVIPSLRGPLPVSLVLGLFYDRRLVLPKDRRGPKKSVTLSVTQKERTSSNISSVDPPAHDLLDSHPHHAGAPFLLICIHVLFFFRRLSRSSTFHSSCSHLQDALLNPSRIRPLWDAFVRPLLSERPALVLQQTCPPSSSPRAPQKKQVHERLGWRRSWRVFHPSSSPSIMLSAPPPRGNAWLYAQRPFHPSSSPCIMLSAPPPRGVAWLCS